MGVIGYDAWLRTASRRGADDEQLAAIATSNSLRRDAFDVLGTMTPLVDGAGRSYFLVPPGMSGADVARAAGVSRPTVYRRWADLDAQVITLVGEIAGSGFPGNIVTD